MKLLTTQGLVLVIMVETSIWSPHSLSERLGLSTSRLKHILVELHCNGLVEVQRRGNHTYWRATKMARNDWQWWVASEAKDTYRAYKPLGRKKRKSPS